MPEMSSSRSMSEASMKREIANSPGTSELFKLVNQGDQWQHGLFRDKSLNVQGSQKRKGKNLGLSQVDMAYRKLGHQLSLRAHGSFVASNHQTSCTIGKSEGSSFAPYSRLSKRTNHIDVGSGRLTQMIKAEKARPSSHENYWKPSFRKRNILRHLTMNASKILRMLQDDMIAGSQAARPTDSSRQQFPHLRPEQQNERTPSNWLQEDSKKEQTTNEFSNKTIISLQKADRAPTVASHSIEMSSTRPQHLNFEPPIDKARDPSGTASFHQQQTGKCLTDPFLSTSNNGFDDANGDLILYENDVIRVPRNKIHVLSKERMRNVAHVDYRVQKRLGQGTFAQVFQCLHLQTGKLVALKIVKNKAAYARQASIEIDVLRALKTKIGSDGNELTVDQTTFKGSSSDGNRGTGSEGDEHDYMVDLVCYFLYKSHLCLVFELLGQNLYDVLKQRNFRGLRLSVVRSVIRQAVHGIVELAKHDVIHCDIKPENILLVNEDGITQVGNREYSDNTLPASSASIPTQTVMRTQPQYKIATVPPPNMTANQTARPQASFTSASSISENAATNTHCHRIKLIDFGSACFKGQTMQTYIQSRFYRSPEVLIGLPYDSAIDIWSLGCVTAELFLGLPILPGVHEHDQLGRILEMISTLPEWMLEQGSKAPIFFNKETSFDADTIDEGHTSTTSSLQYRSWRLKSQSEFVASLSEGEIRRKGGQLRLEKQHHNRYFKKKRLADIVLHKGQSGTMKEDKYDLDLFVHFLHGLLDPDPIKRWTALQASQHPFLTGSRIREHTEHTYVDSRKYGNLANLVGHFYWEPPSNFRGTGGNSGPFCHHVFEQNEDSRFGHWQRRSQFSGGLQSNGHDDTAYPRVPIRSGGLAELTQSFDRRKPSNVKNDHSFQFVPPPPLSHTPKNGGQTQTLRNGQILPSVGLSQQTQNTWNGHLLSGNGGESFAANDSPSLVSVQTHMFPSPVNSQCNWYNSSSQANDEHRPAFSVPNHAFHEQKKDHRAPVVHHGGNIDRRFAHRPVNRKRIYPQK
ncbi:unnamed protein product [Cylindrotheca closterium]|uniref:Protein kinase domain-containing protein n=1 Tax=Cylindrotheca closterium TaxID=2856 RepID=A0AAD2JI84_9STRA|nr:unnamed protein product [Cylindrotheca closterium]